MHRINLKGRFTPAAVAAAATLAVAGTGSAVAGSLIDSDNIRNNSVRSADVRDRSITGKDLKKETLSVSHLKTSARAALRGQTGPMGPMGAQGLQGPKGEKGDKGDKGEPGAAGATNVTVARNNVAVAAGPGTSVGSVACPDTHRAIGGGFNAGGTSLNVTQSAPSSDGGFNTSAAGSVPNAWRVQIHNPGAATTGVVYVICAAP